MRIGVLSSKRSEGSCALYNNLGQFIGSRGQAVLYAMMQWLGQVLIHIVNIMSSVRGLGQYVSSEGKLSSMHGIEKCVQFRGHALSSVL